MRENNTINRRRNSLRSQLKQIYFMIKFKNPNNSDLQVCGAICALNSSLTGESCWISTIGVKSAWTGVSPEFGIKMMENKVGEIKAPLN